MNCKYLCDSHTHSNCSFDGENTIKDMCKRAEELSMYSIALTDHCECNFYDEITDFFGDFKSQLARAYIEMYDEKREYNGRLKVLCGIELGEPTQDDCAVKDIMSKYSYDFIIGSIHNIKGYEDFYYLKYSYDNIYMLLDKYFSEIKAMIQTCDFDTLAHLTYPLRYIEGKHKMKVDMKRYRDTVDELLELLIKHDRALEINTSGLRQELGVTMPDYDIVKRYCAMGGKLLTIGSDAHKCTDLAKGIEDGMHMAYDAGFRKFTIYEGRKPILLPIE